MLLRFRPALLALGLILPACHALAGGWLVKTRAGDCITEQLTGLAARKNQPRLEALDMAAQARPADHEFKIRKAGGFVSQGVFYDIHQVESIVVSGEDTSALGRPQEYEVRISGGETFRFNDNFGAMYLCPAGVAPARGNPPDACGAIYHVKLLCERLDNGQTAPLHLRFDSNGNGKPPAGPTTQLLELRRIDDAFVAQARHDMAAARVQFERRQQQEQARVREARADAVAKANERQQRTAAVLRSPVGTSVFCGSGPSLLMPGESLGDLMVQCDGMPTEVSVRNLTEAGWNIANQVSTPRRSINGDVGAAVSFQAVKAR